MSAIKLYSQQFDHHQELLRRLIKLKLAFDLSEMGSGKTYIAMYTAQVLAESRDCTKIIFLVPNEPAKVWKKLANNLGIPYNLHNYTKMDNMPEEIMDDQTLIICDEVQAMAATNKKTIVVDQFMINAKASGAMVLLLSATPFPDYSKAYMLFVHLGIIKGNPRPDAKELKAFNFPMFLKKLMDTCPDFCQNLNPLMPYGKTKDQMFKSIHDAIISVYSSRVRCVLPEGLAIKQYNLVFNHDDIPGYSSALSDFRQSSAFFMDKAAEKLELLKLPKMANFGLDILKSRQTNKIILCVSSNQLAHFLTMFYANNGYPSVCVNSGVDQLGRQVAQSQFNMHSLTYRVIIITYSVASSGISLHDNSPPELYPNGFPRVMISFIPINPLIRTQLLGRHIRTGITSKIVTTLVISTDAEIDGKSEREIFYGKSGMDTTLINRSVVSTSEPSLFPVMAKNLPESDCSTMKKIIDDLDVYIVDE